MTWKTDRQAGRGKIREKAESEGAPLHPQPPQPLTQQDAPPLQVPICLKILRFIPNGWCGSYRGVGPLIANSDGDSCWG